MSPRCASYCLTGCSLLAPRATSSDWTGPRTRSICAGLRRWSRRRRTPHPSAPSACYGRRSRSGAGRRSATSRFGGLAASEAAGLNDSRLVALTQRIELELALGRHADLVGELENLVAEHPFQERLRAQLILALYRSGRQAEALEAYRDARRALDELGIEPSAELQQLEKAILTHDDALATPQLARRVTQRDNRRMSELPHGTVTLLFTDIEGSTQLQHRLGELYPEVVGEHRRLLEEAFAAHRGVVVDRQTESFFVAFQRARDATLAAAAGQRALASHPWPDGVRVSVRMGIHSGDPEVAGDRYVGLAVSRAARICAAGHGGQVLLSSSARALIGDDGGTTVRTLGSYRLKDFPAPEPISQLEIEGLPRRFPPLRTGAKRPRRKRLVLAAAAVLALVGGDRRNVGRVRRGTPPRSRSVRPTSA